MANLLVCGDESLLPTKFITGREVCPDQTGGNIRLAASSSWNRHKSKPDNAEKPDGLFELVGTVDG